jgi:MFS family permease
LDYHLALADREEVRVVAVAARAPSRLWQNLTVRLCVALAFADASIVVIALPQIVTRLHTSISHVVWVIMAYNLALMVGSAVAIPFARQLASTTALTVGLALFAIASLGCGLANHLSELIPLRCVQGVGGGLLLCASLPLFARTARPGDSPLYGWSAAAAVGMAVGPAAGGILTQLFDWRSIFLVQAPVAALAIVLVFGEHVRSAKEREEEIGPRESLLDPLTANLGLVVLSAGLIAALFLVVIVLINVWLLTPIAAAAVVSTLPITTAIAERAVRGHSPVALAAGGAVLVAAGLVGMAFISHREVVPVIVALALIGTGLGLAFPGLTTAALGRSGPPAARAAWTVVARDGGVFLGLLVLTPVFVNQLSAAPNKAFPEATRAVLGAPLPTSTKLGLAPGLIGAYKKASQSELPNFHPTFVKAEATATPAQRVQLAAVEKQLNAIVQRAATSAFKKPLRYGALFAIAVLPLLALRLWYVRRREQGIGALSPP